MKQCQSNPWAEFSSTFKKGDKVSGTIKSITDFGIFIGLPGGIDGLVHLSDISWDLEGEEAVRNFTKGEELETTVLAIDPERERISLGIKQLDQDPLSGFLAEHPKGSILKGTVTEVDARGAILSLGVAHVLLRPEACLSLTDDIVHATATDFRMIRNAAHVFAIVPATYTFFII